MLPGDRPITMLPADAVETGKPSAWSSQAALSFVVLFGIANLFADTSYEGARSVTGPFLGTLGASGLIVGTVAGLRELLGYTLRFISGRWADRSRLYWSITLLGYSVHSGISGCRKLAACRRAYRARAGGEGDAHLSARCDAGTGRRGYGTRMGLWPQRGAGPTRSDDRPVDHCRGSRMAAGFSSRIRSACPPP